MLGRTISYINCIKFLVQAVSNVLSSPSNVHCWSMSESPQYLFTKVQDPLSTSWAADRRLWVKAGMDGSTTRGWRPSQSPFPGPSLTAGGQNQLSWPSASLKQETASIMPRPSQLSAVLAADGGPGFLQHVAETTLRPDVRSNTTRLHDICILNLLIYRRIHSSLHSCDVSCATRF